MGSGGGATDFRLLPSPDSTGFKDFDSLKSRIMVAGAGGGGCNYWPPKNNYDAKGGSAGGLTGFIGERKDNPAYGITTYQGGTQTSGGYTTNGNGVTKVGIGSFGYAADSAGSAPSGGGGYYGGGTAMHTSAAGGGSSFISGYEGCDAIASDSTATNIIHTGQPDHYSGMIFSNAVMIDGNSEMPTHDGSGTMTGNVGTGYAKITYIG